MPLRISEDISQTLADTKRMLDQFRASADPTRQQIANARELLASTRAVMAEVASRMTPLPQFESVEDDSDD